MVSCAEEVFDCFAKGTVSMLVCSDKCLSHADVEAYANDLHPVNSYRWVVASPLFTVMAGLWDSNPIPCPHCDTHKHYLLILIPKEY